MESVTDYDEYADAYESMFSNRGEDDESLDHITTCLLGALGDVDGLKILDAGCGEGYLTRILSRKGAQVIGVDISPRLVEIAKRKESAATLQVADLSKPIPELAGQFDRVVSHLVLNDVEDYKGFIETIWDTLKSSGKVSLSLNNPYSFVTRGHIEDYFESGRRTLYQGMAKAGLRVHYYHRTLADYLNAFSDVGFRLDAMHDLPHFEPKPVPFFLVLSFTKSVRRDA